MNFILTCAETAISYAFPQTAAAIGSYRAVKTVYRIGKVVAGIFSGDPSAAIPAAQLAGRAAVGETCEEARDICIKAALEFNNGIGSGCAIVGCHAAYLFCKWFNS